MMIPMVLGSMGMKRIVVQVVNRFGYRRVLVVSTLGPAAVSLLFMFSALAGWYYVLPLVLFLQGDDQRQPLLLDEYPDAERSPGRSGQQRQQPAVDGDAAVDEYRRDHRRAAAGAVWPAAYEPRRRQHPSGLSLHLSEHGGDHRSAGAHLFRVPDDVGSNTVLRRRNRSGS